MRTAFLMSFLTAGLIFAGPHAHAADWTNSGGNAGRNGFTTETGPTSANVLWTGGRSSIIAWQPVIADRRVFLVRQTGFPPGGEPNGSPLVAMDLDTGAELWFVDVPFVAGDWTTWVAGVSNGKVYASRGGNGASVAAPIYAYSVENGAQAWVSAEEVDAGAYDGVVFAPNGDLIVASFRTIKRIRAIDGTTAWTANRVGSVSGSCGAALGANAVYVADAVVGGHAVKRFDLVTGAYQYQSPVLAGFTIQNTPMVGPDGTVYLSRVQNNVSVDRFYALNDSGAALTIRWHVPAQWTTTSEFAADGTSVYMMDPGNIPTRRSAADGSVLARAVAPIPADFSQPRMAIDAAGRLFLSNGAFSNGRFYCFEPDLTERWSIPVPNINIGAPAIGRDGTLVVAGIGSSATAYRTAAPPRCVADVDDGSGTGTPDGGVTIDDLLYYLAIFEDGDVRADVDNGTFTGTPDGGVTIDDLLYFLFRFEAGC